MKWRRMLLAFATTEGVIVLLAWLLTVRSSRLAFNRSLLVVAAIAAGLALIAVAGSGMAGGPLRISVGTGAAGNSLGYLTALSADPKGIQEAFRQERRTGPMTFAYPLTVFLAASLALVVAYLAGAGR